MIIRDYAGLIEQTCRLELAEVTSINKVKIDINAMDETSRTDAKEEFINEVSNSVFKSFTQIQHINRYMRGQHTSSPNYNNDYRNRRGGKVEGKRLLKCRNCQRTQHLVRQCPTRFSQSCGERGHNA